MAMSFGLATFSTYASKAWSSTNPLAMPLQHRRLRPAPEHPKIVEPVTPELRESLRLGGRELVGVEDAAQEGVGRGLAFPEVAEPAMCPARGLVVHPLERTGRIQGCNLPARAHQHRSLPSGRRPCKSVITLAWNG